MKRIVVGILLLGQILWVCHNGFVFSVEDKNLPTIQEVEIRGCFGIFRVVYNNFLESLGRVMELACEVGGMSEKRVPMRGEGGKREVLYFSTGSNFINNLLVRWDNIFGSSRGIILGKMFGEGVVFRINMLWMLGIFIWIVKLRYFYLRPRGSIDSWLIRLLGLEIRDPNCFCEYKSSRGQLGFFIYIGVLDFWKELVLGLIFKYHRLVNNFYFNFNSFNNNKTMEGFLC